MAKVYILAMPFYIKLVVIFGGDRTNFISFKGFNQKGKRKVIEKPTNFNNRGLLNS
jgi:hypothetical protein